MFDWTLPKIPKGVEIGKAEKCIIPVCCFKIAWIFFCLFVFSILRVLIRFIIYFCSETSCYRQNCCRKWQKNHCHSFSFLMPGVWTRRPQPAPLIFPFSLARRSSSPRRRPSLLRCASRSTTASEESLSRRWASPPRLAPPTAATPGCNGCVSHGSDPAPQINPILFVPHQKVNKKKATSTLTDPRCPPTRALLHIRRKAIQLNSPPPHFHGYCWRFYGNPRLWRWQKQPWSITAQINL